MQNTEKKKKEEKKQKKNILKEKLYFRLSRRWLVIREA